MHGPISPSCTQAKEGDEVQQTCLKAMLDHLWEVDPDITLVINPHHRCALTSSDILPGTEEDKLPDRWKWQAHTRHFCLQMGGSEPEHQICVSHDDPLGKLLKHLASLEQPNGFHFSKHPHQTWKVVQFCWLHGSNEHCDTKPLAKEMMNHSQFRPHASVGLHCHFSPRANRLEGQGVLHAC